MLQNTTSSIKHLLIRMNIKFQDPGYRIEQLHRYRTRQGVVIQSHNAPTENGAKFCRTIFNDQFTSTRTATATLFAPQPYSSTIPSH